jgi:UDP-N-acetylglucosamine 3-dehydrogenase
VTPLRVAVIGLGRMGRRHLDVLQRLADVDVCGVLDHHADWVEAHRYGDMADLLGDNPGAVVVATPPGSHYSVALQALRAGVHVLVEKPMTGDIDLARNLVAQADAVSRVLAVGFVERFNTALPTLPHDATTLTTRRTSTSTPVGVDIDVILDLAVHDVDLVRFLTGSEYNQRSVEVKRRNAAGLATEATFVGCLANGVDVRHDVAWDSRVRERTLAWSSPVGAGRVDLSLPGPSLTSQAKAFVEACRGAPVRRLGSGADGLQALRCLTTAATVAPSDAMTAPRDAVPGS